MTRILLAALGGASADPLARLARALRDGGLEVVHAGGGQVPAGTAAAAVQEDVEVVVLVADDRDAAERDVGAALAEVDAGDVLVVVAAQDEDAASVVGRVGRVGRVVGRVVDRAGDAAGPPVAAEG